MHPNQRQVVTTRGLFMDNNILNKVAEMDSKDHMTEDQDIRSFSKTCPQVSRQAEREQHNAIRSNAIKVAA